LPIIKKLTNNPLVQLFF